MVISAGCSDEESSIKSYKLEVSVKTKKSGTVEISPEKDSYNNKEEVTLDPKPADGYSFSHWEGSGYDGNSKDPLTINMINDLTLVAAFKDSSAPGWNVEPNITTEAGKNSVGISAALNQSGTIYYKVMSDESAGLTAEEVKAAGNGISAAKDTTQEITIDNLNSGTEYSIFFIAKDNVGNLQSNSEVKKVDISTELSAPLNSDLTVNVPAGTTAVDNGEITLSYNIEMGKYEVTNKEYVKFLNSAEVASDGTYKEKEVIDLAASSCQIGYDGNEFYVKDWTDSSSTQINVSNYPVVEITWYGAIAYCNWLSKQKGLDLAYDLNNWELKKSDVSTLEGYRLPTETEWKYAARGGVEGEATTYAGSDNLVEVGWSWDNADAAGNSNFNSGKGTMTVGQKTGNELNIYDMSGNVWEWTNSTPDDFNRIKQGGSWQSQSQYCNVTYSNGYNPNNTSYEVGFRLTRTK